ncbi:MAG: hypothetical protein P8X89_22680, partial [Reinekea sp.]
CNNTNYDHYYNQAHQEDGQHTFQPETGQTSAGAWGSHPAGSYPAPGQLQPYLNSNLPAQIPASPRPDWEYFLGTPQPMALEDIIPSQRHLEGGQHTFAPETGQTSAGGSASGAWGSHPAASYPAPGQLQPYLNPNLSAQIPPSPAPDWERFLGTPQPMALEDIIPSQRHLEGGQHTFAPETGQTGGSASGVWGSHPAASYPAPGQLQPYQDLNPPAPMPSWPDWGTSQPTTVADLSQNDALPESSNPQPAAPAYRYRPSPLVKKRFLAGLEAYARGELLKDCSDTLRYRRFVTDDGILLPVGKALRDTLSSGEQDRVNQALLSRREFCLKRAMDNPPVEERFLAGLDNYARGVKLADCSATLQFNTYVTDHGLLLPQGDALFKSLSERDQARVNEALLCRSESNPKQAKKKYTTPIEERFLASLDNYAQGLKVDECGENIILRAYLSDDGRLLPGRGLPLYNRLSRDDQERVDKALTARGKIYAQYISRDVAKFMAALEPYGNGLSLKECGRKSGLKTKASAYLTPEGGLTHKGQRLIENLQPDQLNKVLEAIRKRLQHAELDPQVPGPAWQWPEIPASMPEMGGMDLTAMDPTAMVDPMQTESMQTEAMWASVWQLTGQALPGPLGAAVPPIPYYDSETIGGDFQHQYGSYGLPRTD